MNKIINEFNDFFDEDAYIVIEEKYLKITIGNKTMIIKLPSIVGAQSKG